MILHVQRQGAELRLSGQTISIWADKERIGVAQLPLLEGIVVHGRVSLTVPLLSRLLSEGIDCAFLSLDGRFKGRLESLHSKAAHLRTLQALAAARPEVSLNIARRIVRNKLSAQARCCRVLARHDGAAIDKIIRLRGQALAAYSMAELQGIEGYSSRVYFGALKQALTFADREWTREHRHARDRLNALLNYGYAVLQARVHSTVATVGLDPHLGFLHQIGRPRPAFVLDMMEEFRPILVDTTCWWLLGRLGPKGWWEATENGVLLSSDCRLELLRRLETRLGAQTIHHPSGTRTSLARCIELQVRGFAALLQGGRRRYLPLHP